MSSLVVGRHYSKNMVGNINVDFKVSLAKRYMHKPKHYKQNSNNIISIIFLLLEMVKRIDNKVGMKPNFVYWSLWGAALFVFAIAAISLEMQWISSMMTNWD